jgi:hypothetical protein
VTGGTNGLGLNPFPTLDWNRLAVDVSLFWNALTLAIHYSILYKRQLIYRCPCVWSFDDAPNVPSKYVVHRVFAFQREYPVRSVWTAVQRLSRGG